MNNIELKEGECLYPVFLLHTEVVKSEKGEFGVAECDISIKKRDGGTYKKTTKFFVEVELANKFKDKEYLNCVGVFKMIDPVNPSRLVNLFIKD